MWSLLLMLRGSKARLCLPSGFVQQEHAARSEASTVAELCPVALSDLESKTNKELSDDQDESCLPVRNVREGGPAEPVLT